MKLLLMAMNKQIRLCIVFFLPIVFATCTKKWDDHNQVTDTNINSNLAQLIGKTSGLAKFSDMLVKTGYDKIISSSKTYTVWAPTNDAFNCATMVDLGVAPACPGAIFTNANATPSIIATVDTVSCFNSATAQRDVWFRFTCSDTLFDYRIYLKSTGGDPIENPEFAIYRGDCAFNGLAEIASAPHRPCWQAGRIL